MGIGRSDDHQTSRSTGGGHDARKRLDAVRTSLRAEFREERARGIRDQVLVVSQDELEVAVGVATAVSDLAGNQGSGSLRSEDDHHPFRCPAGRRLEAARLRAYP